MPQTIYEVLWIFIVYAVKWTILSNLRIWNLIGHRSINTAERKFIDPVYRFRDTDLSH